MSALPAAPAERWTIDAAGLQDQAGDLLLLDGGVGGSGGGPRVVDAATGEVLLALDAEPPASAALSVWCHVVRDASPWSYDVLAAAPDALVSCHRAVWGSASVPPETTVEVHDLGDRGRPVVVTLPGQVLLERPVDDDLLLVSQDGEGHVHALRWDPRTGDERWSFRSDAPVGSVDPDTGVGVWADVVGDTVVVSTFQERGVTLDVHDGVPVEGATPRPVEVVVRELADGGVVRVTGYTDPVPRVEVVDGAGRVTLSADGYPGWGEVVDPAAGVVVLHSLAGTATAYRIADGAELWTLDPPEARVLVHLGDVVVLLHGQELAAHDATTGRVMWTRDVVGGLVGQAMTDGARLLVPVDDEDGIALAALEVATGREVWRTPLPRGTSMLVPAASGVLVQTSGELTLLARR